MRVESVEVLAQRLCDEIHSPQPVADPVVAVLHPRDTTRVTLFLPATGLYSSESVLDLGGGAGVHPLRRVPSSR